MDGPLIDQADRLVGQAGGQRADLQGLTPFKMQVTDGSGTKWWNREISFGTGHRRADLLAFTREFATLNAAEIPLAQGRLDDHERNGTRVTRLEEFTGAARLQIIFLRGEGERLGAARGGMGKA